MVPESLPNSFNTSLEFSPSMTITRKAGLSKVNLICWLVVQEPFHVLSAMMP